MSLPAMINKQCWNFLIIFSISFFGGSVLKAQDTGFFQVIEVKAQIVQNIPGGNKTGIEKKVADTLQNESIQEAEEVKSRGVKCEIKFENYTGFLVKVFIDGKYKGTLGAYGEAVYRNLSGYRDIYCVTSSRQFEWITKGNCDGHYEFRLNRETAE